MNIFQRLLQFILNLLKGKSRPTTSIPPQVHRPKPTPSRPQVKPVSTPVETPEEKEEVPTPDPVEEKPSTPKKELTVREEESGGRRRVRVSDGVMEGEFKYLNRGRWKGWYTAGQLNVKDFIEANEAMLQQLNMTESAINVMRAVSDNEGKMEAINAYDGAFLSFGIFQWTLGTGDNKGELPALLKKLKENYPDAFQQHFSQHGLDIDPSTDTTYGFITLNGQRVQSRASKEQFRSPEWVYRFWRAGHDKEMQAIQVEHALSRLKNFYWRWTIKDTPLNELVTSEYGVGLILDNHVNLPYLVKLSLNQAIAKTGLAQPDGWSAAQEALLLDAYLQERARPQPYKNRSIGPMHNAHQRAATTRKYVDRGIISDDRSSFQYSSVLSRGLEEKGVTPPPDFFQEDYPEIDEGIDSPLLFGDPD